MRITAIEPFVCDGGLREFGFLKVTTDEGIVGWAETYDWHTSASLETALEVMGRGLIGEDPRRIELMNERIWYGGRPGVPERRRSSPRSTSRSGTSRRSGSASPSTSCSAASSATGSRSTGRISRRTAAVWPEVVGQPPTHTYAEWAAGARDVVAPGLQGPQDEPHRGGRPGRQGAAPALPRRRDRQRGRSTRRSTWIGTLRDVVGPGIGIAVDVQFDYRMGGIVKLARALEPFDLYWLEVESLDPEALLAAREQTTTRLCHGESLIRREQFRPFFQKHVTDVVMIETLSNGLSRVAPDRRDGRAVRHDGLAAQLDEPARHDDQRPAVRGAARTSRSSRSTSTTCPGRGTC